MENTHKIILVAVLVALGVATWWYMQGQRGYILPIQSGDTVSSWDFQGAREGNPELEQKTKDDIKRMESELGGDQSGVEEATDYSLYVGIAQAYESLGDGEKAREYLEKALAIDSEKTGLAWHNLGALFSRLGAYNTARLAYARAVEAQPHIDAYHLAYIQFLMSHFGGDRELVDAAISGAETQFQGSPAILQIKAQWLEQSGRIQEAIDALRAMQKAMPEDARAMLEVEIKRLQEKTL